METLQILGWIYLGLVLGSIGGVIVLGLFQAGRVTSLEREITDLEFKNRILRGENNRLSKRGKPAPRKRRNWKKKPVKKQIDFFISYIYQCMNKTDKQDLKLIEYRLDAQDESVKNLHLEFDEKLGQIHTDIKFIKENLFNPETGLWAETKLNTQHRQSTTKWRTIIGGGFIALIIDMFWDIFTK